MSESEAAGVMEFPVEMVSLAEIDEPELPVRAAMDDEKLESLTQSIRELGVVEPLILARGDGRAVVVAGHRRLLCARRAGLAVVPARVYPEGHPHLEAIKIHENVEREELNPAEEGVFYQQLLEKFQYTEEEMCKVVKRSADYIAERLKLVRGDAGVLRALLEGKISLGVAQELNKMQLGKDREYYLGYAVQNGAGVKLVREWRHKANLAAESFSAAQPGGEGGVGVASGEAKADPPTPQFLGRAQGYELGGGMETVECRFCGTREQDWKMFKVRVCQPCAQRVFMDSGGRP